MQQRAELFLIKARESLAGAQRELAADAYNNAANRSYYACFQAAIALLLEVGVYGEGTQRFEHDQVAASIAGVAARHKKVIDSELRSCLPDLQAVRFLADYAADGVGRQLAVKAVSDARQFVDTVAHRVESAR